jgi:hypothetical protein
MTVPNSSSTSAVPYRSTLRIVAGDACDGETPAAWIGSDPDSPHDGLPDLTGSDHDNHVCHGFTITLIASRSFIAR